MGAAKDITRITFEHNTNIVNLARLIEGEWYYVMDHCGDSSVGRWQPLLGSFCSGMGDNIAVTAAKEVIKVSHLPFKDSRKFPLHRNPFVKRHSGFKVLIKVPMHGFLFMNAELAAEIYFLSPFNYTVMP